MDSQWSCNFTRGILMNDQERKRYIQEIFKYCTADSILVIDQKGRLTRLRCPFLVLVVVVNISEYTVQPNPEYSIHTDSGVYCTYQ